MKVVLLMARLLVLAASVWMIVWITRDTIGGVNLIASPEYLRFQLWVCVYFLGVCLLEFYAAGHGNRLRWLGGHWFFVLVSVPWLNLVSIAGIQLSPQMAYVIRFIPMVRAGYVLALITGVLSANKAVSLMMVYAMWVAASVYFASLVFFVEEHPINPQVDTWWTALWWTSLCLTTVGPPIEALTATGRVLAVVVACEGLILLPVFTVYVANIFTSRSHVGIVDFDIDTPRNDTSDPKGPGVTPSTPVQSADQESGTATDLPEPA